MRLCLIIIITDMLQNKHYDCDPEKGHADKVSMTSRSYRHFQFLLQLLSSVETGLKLCLDQLHPGHNDKQLHDQWSSTITIMYEQYMY